MTAIYSSVGAFSIGHWSRRLTTVRSACFIPAVSERIFCQYSTWLLTFCTARIKMLSIDTTLKLAESYRIDHLQYKVPREKPIQKRKRLVGPFSFSEKSLQALCRGFYPGSLYWRWSISFVYLDRKRVGYIPGLKPIVLWICIFDGRMCYLYPRWKKISEIGKDVAWLSGNVGSGVEWAGPLLTRRVCAGHKHQPHILRWLLPMPSLEMSNTRRP